MPESTRFHSDPESAGLSPEKLAALFDRAGREVREGLLPSVQIAVARHGKVAAMRTFGRAPFEGREREATDDTLYTIFSCTKAITSAAAWLLLQEGKLDLAERVGDILPEFETNGKDVVTVEQLLLHTAGFPSAPSGPRDWATREALRDRFARWRLNWEPGSRFEYHPSSSMWVVAVIVEERTGQAFGDFVRTRIAGPLGLSDFFVGTPREHHRRIADLVHVGTALTPEDFAKRGWPVPPETEVTEEAVMRFNEAAVREVGVPGGGGVATAADLALFYQGLQSGCGPDGNEVFSRATLGRALEVRSGDLVDPVFGKRVHRALGVCVAGDEDRVYRGFGRTGSEHMFGHNGAGGQIAWADPESGISLAYCTNGFDRDPIRLARRGVAISSRAADLLG